MLKDEKTLIRVLTAIKRTSHAIRWTKQLEKDDADMFPVLGHLEAARDGLREYLFELKHNGRKVEQMELF